MKERIDPLIEERAPWLFAGTPWSNAARDVLTGLLGYPRTLALGEVLQHHPAPVIMDE
jgi:hypothetical protein